MTRPDLGPNQLSWLRLHVPKFRDMERAARSVARETEQSHERHGTWQASVDAANRGDLRPLAEYEAAQPQRQGRE